MNSAISHNKVRHIRLRLDLRKLALFVQKNRTKSASYLRPMLTALCSLINMEIFEVLLILYIPVGTLLLNRWRACTASFQRWTRISYIFVSIILAIIPVLYLRSIEPYHTPLSVIFVGVAFFWFPIVGARIEKT